MVKIDSTKYCIFDKYASNRYYETGSWPWCYEGPSLNDDDEGKVCSFLTIGMGNQSAWRRAI